MPWELVDPLGHAYRLHNGTRIGRASDVGIVISDPQASRVHAEFRVWGDSIMIQDLNSTNGTFVNRVRLISPCRLNSGDRITIGDSTFLVRQVPEKGAFAVSNAPHSSAQTNMSSASANVVIQQISVEPKQQSDQSSLPGQFMYCSVCGRKIAVTAMSCPGCGASLERSEENISARDWLTTLLLCILTGALGIHRFYTGHIGTGILQLLTAGGFGIWWIIDLIRIVTGKFRDSEGRLIAKK